MPDFYALKARASEPDLADVNDEATAQALRQPGEGIVGVVSSNQLLIFAAETGLRDKFETIASTPADTEPGKQLRSICLTIHDAIRSGSIGIDMSNPKNQLMIGALVVAGVMTSEQRTAFIALATRPGPSWEEANWGVELTAAHVAHARSL